VAGLKYLYNGASITEDLDLREQSWEQGDNTLEAQQFFKNQETFAMRVDRVVQEQEELFKENKEKRDRIVKKATIPYLSPDVPEIEINRMDSGRWEAKVTLSGGGDTTSLAIRDLLSITLKMLEELI
tara:strand:+ start:586 stop:966 length:381 start_codon:yes stop_codon:yes gene_type:complete